MHKSVINPARGGVHAVEDKQPIPAVYYLFKYGN
jgi:hypothetical protein